MSQAVCFSLPEKVMAGPALAIPALAFKCFGSVPDTRSNPLLSLNARTRFQLSELWSFPLLKKKKKKRINLCFVLFYLFIFMQAEGCAAEKH